MPIALMGNQMDTDKIQVEENEANEYAQKNGLGFMITSATDINEKEKDKIWGTLIDQIQSNQLLNVYREIKKSSFKKFAIMRKYTKVKTQNNLESLTNMLRSKGFTFENDNVKKSEEEEENTHKDENEK